MMTKAMLITSALVAGTLAMAVDVAALQSDRASPTQRIEAAFDVVPQTVAKLPVPPASLRKPELNEPAPATAPKSGKPASTANVCAKQHWPYITAECLSGRAATRVIKIDRKV